jgi:hypothetical protein
MMNEPDAGTNQFARAYAESELTGNQRSNPKGFRLLVKLKLLLATTTTT